MRSREGYECNRAQKKSGINCKEHPVSLRAEVANAQTQMVKALGICVSASAGICVSTSASLSYTIPAE